MRHGCLLIPALVGALIGCGDDDADPTSDSGTGIFLDGGPDTDSGSVSEDSGVGCTIQSLCGPSDVIVDTAWLEDHLSDPDLQIVDVRSETDFIIAHIPGARRIDGGSLRTTVAGISGQVVDMATAQTVFRAAGLDVDAAIVVYGASTSTTPARLVWTLEYFGHERVALLDGGFDAWNAAAEANAVTPTPSDYTIEAIDETKRVDVDFIEPRLGQITLVDARSDGEFTAGRLPGAISVDWNRNVQSGALRPIGEVAALYQGLDTTRTTVTYCQTGSRASVAYVVLRWLGFSDVRLYDGSWAEWGGRTDLPREP